MAPDLALRDHSHVPGVHDLDRVFDRHDVDRRGAVQQIDQRGERGRLAVAVRPGDHDEPLVMPGDLGDLGGQAELVERGRAFDRQPKCALETALLARDVAAQPARARHVDREIDMTSRFSSCGGCGARPRIAPTS